MFALRSVPSMCGIGAAAIGAIVLFALHRDEPVARVPAPIHFAPPTLTIGPSVAVAPTVMPVANPVASRFEISVFAYDAVVDATHVYWTQASGNDGAIASLYRARIDGGARELVAASAGYSLVLDGDRLFYADGSGKSIHRFDLGDNTDRVIAKLATEPLTVTVGGGYVYWTGWNRKTAQRVSVDGGAITTLTAGAAADPIAADDEHLYIASVSTGKLSRIAHGTTGATPVSTGLKGAQTVVVVGDHVYANAKRVLFRVPKSGGALERVATAGEAHRLVASGGNIYWTTWADDKLASTPECDGFQRGVIREVTDRGVEVVASECPIRGIAAGAGGLFVIEHDRIRAR